jgi:hypothetical protein
MHEVTNVGAADILRKELCVNSSQNTGKATGKTTGKTRAGSI